MLPTNNPVSLIPFDRAKNLNRGGRPKGSTNLARRNAQAAIKLLVEKNIPRVQKWLDSIEKEHGAQAAYRCFLDLIEYAVPKMSRNETEGDIAITVSWGSPDSMQQVTVVDRQQDVAAEAAALTAGHMGP
jgi:hypothetical protein